MRFARLLAPILAYTAEEAWRHSAVASIGDADQPGSPTPATTSVHVQEFPQSRNPIRKADDQMEKLLKCVSLYREGIEKARQEKLIGNSLEAPVVLIRVPMPLIYAWQGKESEEINHGKFLAAWKQAKQRERFGNGTPLQKMRPLLATSVDCRHEQSAPGFVR